MDLAVIASKWWFFSVTLAVLVALLWAGNRYMLGPHATSLEGRYPRLLGMLVLTVVGVIVLVIAIPTTGPGDTFTAGLITEETRRNLLTVIGLAVTALITLSSTTLAANGMAGLMMRAVGAMSPGDFVRVEEHFGRITERGLFHTEIQTEDRDLITLPNLYLATNPVRVVRRSGTIISCDVSLGYAEPRTRIQELLIEAGEAADLAEPYVRIMELQDHVVVYRVCGFLADIKTLVSARSRLHGAVLDTLHGAGVEIVSPGFVYQRRSEESQSIIPRVNRTQSPEPEVAVEDVVFDKAEEAETLEQLKARRTELERALRGNADEDQPQDPEALKEELRVLEERIEESSTSTD